MCYFWRFCAILLTVACFVPNNSYAVDDPEPDDTYECSVPSLEEMCDIAIAMEEDGVSVSNCTANCTDRCDEQIDYTALPNGIATCRDECWTACEQWCDNNNGCYDSSDACYEGRGPAGNGCALGDIDPGEDPVEEECEPEESCGDWISYNTTTESQTCTYEESDCTSYSTTMYRCKSGYYATGTTPNANPNGLGCISQMDCDIMVAFWRDMINMTAQERIAYCQNKGAYLEPALHDGLLCEIVRSNNGVPSQCSVCTPGEECTNWTRISQEFERGACTITTADCDVSQTLKYRCAVGYYATGTSPNATQSGLNCTACPTMYDNTVPTTTAEAGQTSIAACCVDNTYSPFSNTIGTFHINGECCWVP